MRQYLLLVVVGAVSCGPEGANEDEDDLTPVDFNVPAQPLTAVQVGEVIERAAEALDSPDLIVAVVDRLGRVVGLWQRDPATTEDDQNRAVAIARSAAFLSSSQGPLSSRTLEFISTFHFPPTFGDEEALAFPTLVPQRATTGVRNTPQGPLWQIFTSNRGAVYAAPGLTEGSAGVATEFQPGKAVPPAQRVTEGMPDGVPGPGPGLGYLPGGIPLYNEGRIVGGVGCFGPPSNACEYAALQGAGELGFQGIPPEGAIFLVGVLLPYVEQTARPGALAPGTFDPAGLVISPRAGVADPEGYLIGPNDDPLGGLAVDDVERIVEQGVTTANGTRAAIRLPLGTTTKMVIGVTNRQGLILALYRMPDAPIFSIDVALTKARTVVYYSSTDLHPDDAIPGIPTGTAITTRTLGFLSQPFFPPNIHHTQPGPIYHVAIENQDPSQFDRMGKATPRPGLQSGLIFFPGSAPLYKGGQLVGGLGISGDGVEQDDFVTDGALDGFEAPAHIRADKYSHAGVRLPYFKFPQLPGDGGR